MTERRRFLRFDTALNALCDFVSDRSKASCKVKNLSKEGALIVSDKRLRQGSEIHLTMDVPGDNVPIFASCEVAWQKGQTGTGSYETGLKFKKIENSDKGRLLEYIYTQWLKLLDKQ
ncbi:MAG: PilZ domain-containing protein [Candidatus Omnitrophica bacterium]|nr:PilZ domain-containing protein [Candidatus Omnitrophota bacterium]